MDFKYWEVDEAGMEVDGFCVTFWMFWFGGVVVVGLRATRRLVGRWWFFRSHFSNVAVLA